MALAWPAQALTTQSSGARLATPAEPLQSAATTRQSCDAAPGPVTARCLAIVRLSGGGITAFAAAPSVTAVGGTSLKRSSSASRGWTETAWSGAGSGCSKYNSAISGASGTRCGKRAVADVSAVADPATGVTVYDSFAFQGASGWLTFGGTSVSSPIIATVYALAGNASSIDNTYPYKHACSLNDVTSGSNGSCSTTQWCKARKGWDGPTGLGSPHDTGAF